VLRHDPYDTRGGLCGYLPRPRRVQSPLGKVLQPRYGDEP